MIQNSPGLAEGVSDQQLCVRVFFNVFSNWFTFFVTFSNLVHFCCILFEKCCNYCSSHCFLFEQRAREGASLGACRHVNRNLFDLGGNLFLNHFLKLVFSHKIAIFDENGSQNGNSLHSLGSIVSHKLQKRKSVFRLHRRIRIAYEPFPWSTQCDPKYKKKMNIFQVRVFHINNSKISET